MEIMTRKQAIEKGLNKYFTGKKCKHGHISERWINSGCIECKTNKDQSGRADGRKLDPSMVNEQSIRLPVLDDTALKDTSLVPLDSMGMDLQDHTLTKTEWVGLAQVVNKADSFRQWMIGDLYNTCEWGSKANMLEAHGINPNTAQEYGRVCSRIPHELRRPNLTFGHHQALCVQQIDGDAMMIQFMDKVENHKMTINQVRKMVKNLQKMLPGTTEDASPHVPDMQEFLKSYKSLGKEMKTMTELPPTLMAAFETLLVEFQKLSN